MKTFLASAALLALLVLSVVLAKLHLGTFNVVASLVIAAAKASIVIIVFMKLGEGHPSIRLAFVCGVGWLGIMIALTLGDFLSRGALVVH